jgi:D-alanyl-D-alanine carboxypeptidase
MTCELLRKLAVEFGVPSEVFAGKSRVAYPEAKTLVVADADHNGKQHLLTPGAAEAWTLMRDAAGEEGIQIFIVSAFRSIERQTELVRRKFASGIPVDQILAVSALPGFSEHHTGRAVDIGTPGSAVLEAEFEQTAAYTWLQARAADFAFRLSYPRGNSNGYIYEPWHWCYQVPRHPSAN